MDPTQTVGMRRPRQPSFVRRHPGVVAGLAVGYMVYRRQTSVPRRTAPSVMAEMLITPFRWALLLYGALIVLVALPVFIVFVVGYGIACIVGRSDQRWVRVGGAILLALDLARYGARAVSAASGSWYQPSTGGGTNVVP